MSKNTKAKDYFIEEMSGEPLTQDSVIEGLEEFAKIHIENFSKEFNLSTEWRDSIKQNYIVKHFKK